MLAWFAWGDVQACWACSSCKWSLHAGEFELFSCAGLRCCERERGAGWSCCEAQGLRPSLPIMRQTVDLFLHWHCHGSMRFAATCLNILGLASCSASCFWHLKDTCCAPQQEDCKNIRQNVPLNLCEDKFRHSSASDKEGGFEMLPWGDPWHDGHMLEA